MPKPTPFLPILLCLLLPVFPLHGAPAPQTNLPTVTLTLGDQALAARVAADDPSRERGLMSRTNLAENEAMLFVFPSPRPVSFWMKDTPVPLSIAYIGPSGRIFEIHDLKPLDETPVPSASSAIVYAIEAPQGWFSRHGVLAGSVVGGLPSPSTAK